MALWGYDVYEKEDMESLSEGEKNIFKGNIVEVKDHETKREKDGLKECIINGGFEEGGIRLCLDYDDHSSVSNIGDKESDWARGDASAFADFIKDKKIINLKEKQSYRRLPIVKNCILLYTETIKLQGGS